MEKKRRCHWCRESNPLYVRYHDEEWGRPMHDDDKLFEMLMLETFQAGLSWECVLNKREAFREAFDNFEYRKIAEYGETTKEQLLQNPYIIRNKLKISATIINAGVFMKIRNEYGSFDSYLWEFTEGKIIYEHDKTRSHLSDKISKDLQVRGMKFVGTTIIYSYLQAVGIINSHEPECWLYHPSKPQTNE